MICKKCGSGDVYKNGKNKYGQQKYRCKGCSYNFEGDTVPGGTKHKIGMTLDEFKNKHDVEHIVMKTLEKLDKDIIYSKDDIVKLAAISYGAQGLTPILEAQILYYGKTGGKTYYSHPDTIQMLKDKAKLN